MDEPLANVNPQISGDIYDLLKQLNKQITILMVSHDMSAISSHVKTIGCLNRRLFYHGVAHRVFPEHTTMHSTPEEKETDDD